MIDQGVRAPIRLNINKAEEKDSSGKSDSSSPVLALERGLLAIRAFVRKAPIASSDDAQRRAKLDWAQRIWNEGWPLSGTVAEVYLLSRGIAFDKDFPEALRFHPSISHEITRTHYAALIAAVTDLDGQFVGLDRTYLAPTGRCQAEVSYGRAKRTLGEWFGSHIHLSEDLDKKLVIAESIETALTIQRACPELPVWASMTLGNMKAPVPTHVQELYLCPDHDRRDPRSAERLLMDAVRVHQKAGHRVLLILPPHGLNFNDLLLAESTRGQNA